MPTTPAHVHMVVSGTQPGGEVFAFGFDTNGDAGNQATLDAAVLATANVLTTASASKTTFQSLLTAQGAYTKVTGYSYAAGATTAALVSSLAITVAGSGSGSLPFQVSLVATLRTPIPSRRTRGRMYLPATGVTIGTTAGFLTAPTPAAVAAAVKALITAQGSLITPVVISRTAGSATAISQVSVDNKLDIQRRRANKQVATVSSSVNVP